MNISGTSEHSEHNAVTPMVHGWPQVTLEQRQRDQQIRLEQAEARRLANDAIRNRPDDHIIFQCAGNTIKGARSWIN